MALPLQVLKSASIINSDQSLLLGVLRILIKISSDHSNSSSTSAHKKRGSLSDNEIDPPSNNLNNETLKNDPASVTKNSLYSNNDSNLRNTDLSVIQLAAKMLLEHLFYFLGHFPLPILGAARLSSFVSELDDNNFLTKNEDHDELTSEVLNAPNVLFFIINNSSIVSIVDLGLESSSDDLTNQQPLVRIIVRDLIGKFSWDSTIISSFFNFKTDPSKNYFQTSDSTFKASILTADQDDKEDVCNKIDPLDLLIKNIGKNVLNIKNGNFTSPNAACNDNLDQLEENMIALLSNQHYQEMNFIEKSVFKNLPNLEKDQSVINASHDKKFLKNNAHLSFMNGRQLIDHLGFFLWEKRANVELLNKNEKLLRELRNLDAQKCRETHKIAVIYVAEGQEDKNSILMNKAGSEAFEKFVAGLGWEVNLENHLGFRGGLQQNKSTGDTTPYYATSFYEVIFHVSTRIPASIKDSDSIRRKLTHLGNDEVHIVWSEHHREYRRGIIPTEFCDVLIVIYPLNHYPGFYRIFVSRKPEVPFFGPLYSGAFVHHNVLADLVRATAINASRAGRLQVPFYQNYFEERAKSIETIIKYHHDN